MSVVRLAPPSACHSPRSASISSADSSVLVVIAPDSVARGSAETPAPLARGIDAGF